MFELGVPTRTSHDGDVDWEHGTQQTAHAVAAGVGPSPHKRRQVAAASVTLRWQPGHAAESSRRADDQ